MHFSSLTSLNPHTFDSALKKVPARVESCAWARSATFLQKKIVRGAQELDFAYDRDVTGVLGIVMDIVQLLNYSVP